MASIDPRMWDDDRFNALDPVAKLLWAYLLTGPHTVAWVPGIVQAGTASLAEAMRCSEKAIRAALADLRKAGLVDVDEPRRIVRLPNAPAYNPPGNPNVMRGFHRRWRALPECPAKYAHLKSVSVWESVFSAMYAETFGSESLPEAFRKPLGNPFESLSKDTVTETETETGNRDRDQDPSSDPDPDAREGSTPQAKRTVPSEEAHAVARYLLDAIRSHHPEHSDARVDGWARDIDLAIRVDGVSADRLRAAIDFAHRSPDAFWRSNVLSGSKLRARLDQLEIRAAQAAATPRRMTPADLFAKAEQLRRQGE